MKIYFSPQERQFLKTIRDSKLKRRLKKKILILRENPFPPGSKKLHGREKTYRLRVGPYRFIYSVRNIPDEIRILAIGKRENIYS